jgi:hypothetical protein
MSTGNFRLGANTNADFKKGVEAAEQYLRKRTTDGEGAATGLTAARKSVYIGTDMAGTIREVPKSQDDAKEHRDSTLEFLHEWRQYNARRRFFISSRNADGDFVKTYSDGTQVVEYVQNDGINPSGVGEIRTPTSYQLVKYGKVIKELEIEDKDKSKSNADLLKEAVLQLAEKQHPSIVNFDNLLPYIQRVIVSTYGEAERNRQEPVAAVRGFLGELETRMNEAAQSGVKVKIGLNTDDPSNPELYFTAGIWKSTGPLRFKPSGSRRGQEPRRATRE